MKFSIRFADQIVGTLVLLALAILVFVIFMLGKNQRWFVKDCQYKAYFASASGISPNMAVQYKGFTIGHVKKLSLADDDRVEVVFSIYEEYTYRVTEGSLVERMESPIGLGSSFNFYPGKTKEELPEGSVIPTVNSPEAKKYIAEGLADIPKSNDSIGNIVNQVNSILETVNAALAGSSGDPAIGQIISNVEGITAGLQTLAEDLSGQIKPILTNLEEVTDILSDPSGAVMGILDGKGPLYEAINSLAGIIENLNKTSQFIPTQLPQIATAINELNILLKQVEDVLTSVANNPLLKGGIPENKETGPSGASPRNQKF
jgi:phospholipid/cholesterol/gamma-HCH transport system substrate-binding protein